MDFTSNSYTFTKAATKILPATVPSPWLHLSEKNPLTIVFNCVYLSPYCRERLIACFMLYPVADIKMSGDNFIFQILIIFKYSSWNAATPFNGEFKILWGFFCIIFCSYTIVGRTLKWSSRFLTPGVNALCNPLPLNVYLQSMQIWWNITSINKFHYMAKMTRF